MARDGKGGEVQVTGYTNKAFVTDEVSSNGPPPPLQPPPPGPKSEPVVEDVAVNLTEVQQKEKKLILKNVFIISLAFTFQFISYNGMVNLQSSINKTGGTTSLSALYVSFILSCCLVSNWVLARLRERNTLALCMALYSLYMGAQFYPRTYTLVPTAIILGMAAAPMWTAKCNYLTKVGGRYAELVGVRREVIITRFFGIFFFFFQMTQVWGNVISSTVLSVGVSDEPPSELEWCGYSFCPGDEGVGGGSGDIPEWQRYTMAAVYLACVLVAALVVYVFVDPLDKFGGKETNVESEQKSSVQLIAATLNQLRNPYQLLIIPITVWSGLEQAFLSADYTAAYVSCGLGVHMVGFVIICYGLCDAVCSIGFTYVVKRVGRVPVFLLGAGINVGIVLALVYWRPGPGDVVWFFVAAGLWGVADAVWQTQINAFYGVLFPHNTEAAFSNYRLWESVGFTVAFAFSTVLCVEAKVTLLFVFLAVGMAGYLVVEGMEWKKGRKGVKGDE